MKVAASIGRLHIVAIAALGTFTFGWIFTGEHRFDLAAVAALDWFLVNLLNRVVDLREDQLNGITGTELVARHKRTLVVVGFGVLAASFVGVHLAVAATLWPLRAAFHALGMAYNWPLLPGVRVSPGAPSPGPRRRIKQLYFFKNTASAAGFLLTVFGFPLAASDWGARLLPGVGWPTVVLGALFFFLFELSYEVLYDLRDAPGDRAADVRTYAVVHGEKVALRIVDVLCVLSVLSIAVAYVAGLVPWRLAVLGVGPLVQIALAHVVVRRGITSADCVGITWLGAGLLFAYHVWVALGLPGAGA
ncbi:MAG: UbiA family prenyltransferase [Deltaproteobacteria bacterium]|nr:UbiA family prenyltransferase [Deltaproteobacteria bacterium]